MKNSILLVDHDPMTATEIYAALEDMGFSVFGPVPSEGEALKAWHQTPPLAAIVNTKTVTIMPELTSILQRSDIPTAAFGENISALPHAYKLNEASLSKGLLEFLIEPGEAQNMVDGLEFSLSSDILEEITGLVTYSCTWRMAYN